MAFVTPDTTEVTTWQGLHLFHFAMSNCSQRVRIMLEEKQLPWTSHHVDIPKGENLTEFYQGINPNGVVPTLVHDGRVIIESTDILVYLDELGSDIGASPRLHRGPGIDDDLRDESIRRANAAQPHIKLLSFEYLFKPVARKNRRELQELDAKLKNRELLQFHRRFSSEEGIPSEEVWQSVCAMHEHLRFLESCLATGQWLAGEHYSIGDIAWIVNLHRLQLMHFPLQNYPALRRWVGEVQRRPSYGPALTRYEPSAALGLVRLYSWLRANFGKQAFTRAPC
jgi:glutathione S-transferase